MAVLATTRPAYPGPITCDWGARHGECSTNAPGDLRRDGSTGASARLVEEDQHVFIDHALSELPLNRPRNGGLFGILLLRAGDYSCGLKEPGSSDGNDDGRWEGETVFPNRRATRVRRAGIYTLDIALPPDEEWGWVDAGDIFDPSKLRPEAPTVGLIVLVCITFLPFRTYARS